MIEVVDMRPAVESLVDEWRAALMRIRSDSLTKAYNAALIFAVAATDADDRGDTAKADEIWAQFDEAVALCREIKERG